MAGSVPENVIIMWAGSHSAANALDGWSRETSLDSKMVKGVSGVGTDAGVAAGATSHDHATASHTHPEGAHTHGGNTGGQSGQNTGGGSITYGSSSANYLHTHSFTTGSQSGPTSGTSTPAWGTSGIEPEYYTIIYIKSDGSGDGFPDDSIVYYNSTSDPTNWTQHAASVGKYFRGAGTGASAGGTGGSATHTHTTAAHTHSTGNHSHGGGNTGGPSQRMSNGNSGTYAAHVAVTTHTTNATSTSGSATSSALTGGTSATGVNDPPSTKMHVIQNDSGEGVWLESAICLFLGTASDATATKFTKCDGNNGTRDLRSQFILNNPSGGSGHGNTSGQTDHSHSSGGHTHTANHSHGSLTFGNAPSDGVFNRNSTSGGITSSNHTHNAGNTSGTASSLTTTSPTLTYVADEQPAYRTVHYLMSGEEPVSGGNVGMFGANF